MRDVFLELYGGISESLADRMRTVARGTVVVDVVKGVLDEARESLREAAEDEQARTGTAFTARLPGVTAVLTDPQPKPRVADQQAFASWFAAAYPDDVKVERRVEVVDQAKALAALDAVYADAYNADERAYELTEALRIVDETLLPEKALDLAVERARIHVTADAAIDVTTGEHVPGLAVTCAAPTLQVRLDKQARAAARREVCDVLGIPAEIGDGR